MAQQRLIVLINSMQWQVLHFSGTRYREMRAYAANEENQLPLLNWIKQFPAATVAFLTDIADEHYHVEVLPHVGGLARKQLLERRMAAWPFAQELHTIHYIDRVQGLRREDRYLFSAMHYPFLQRWLQALQQQEMRVQGIYSQALCLPCWLPGGTHRLCLWLGKQQARLCYLYRNRLLFSRLLALTAGMPVIAHIANEVIQTRFYLMNQQWLQEHETLQLLCLSDDAANDLSRQQWPAEIQPTIVAYTGLIRQFDEAVPDAVSVTEWAAVQVILNTRRLPNFAPAEALMHERIARAKRVIQEACAIMACLFAMTAWSSHQQLQRAQGDTQTAQANLLRWQAAISVPEVSEAALPQLHTLALAMQALEVSALLPDRTWQILQQTMTGQDSWQLQTLAWQYGAATDSKGQDKRWSERVSLIFARKGSPASDSAIQDWQSLLEKLRAHPDVLDVVEIRASNAAGNPVLSGDTRQMPATADSLQLEIRLHQRRKAI